MTGIFDNLRQDLKIERAKKVLGPEFEIKSWFDRFIVTLLPDNASESGSLAASKFAELGYGALLRLHTTSIKAGILRNTERGDKYQDIMREQLSDTIRSAGYQLRRGGLDERFVVSLQMKLLGGALSNLVNTSYQQNVPLLRGFASSLIRKDFVALCTKSGVLPEISNDWLLDAGKALFGGGKEKALDYISQLSSLDTRIFTNAEKPKVLEA